MEALKQCLGAIDLTTLNGADTLEKGRALAQKVNRFAQEYPQWPCVAAICVYPSLVPVVRETLTVPSVRVAAVGGGFPASQTFIEIKAAECAACVKAGANEVDVVISVGRFLAGEYHVVKEELVQLREAIGAAHMKVILESGVLEQAYDSPARGLEAVAKASFLAMEAGADFIKTSTGKVNPAATLSAAQVMCQCIKEYYERTGRKVGFKPAGGIVTPQEALAYREVVASVLGPEWLTPERFRIGASRLANNLLSEIAGREMVCF